MAYLASIAGSGSRKFNKRTQERPRDPNQQSLPPAFPISRASIRYHLAPTATRNSVPSSCPRPSGSLANILANQRDVRLAPQKRTFGQTPFAISSNGGTFLAWESAAASRTVRIEVLQLLGVLILYILRSNLRTRLGAPATLVLFLGRSSRREQRILFEG